MTNSPRLLKASSAKKVPFITTEPSKLPFICNEEQNYSHSVDGHPMLGRHQGNELGSLPSTFAEVTSQVHQGMFNPLYSTNAPFPALRADMYIGLPDRVMSNGEGSSQRQKFMGIQFTQFNEGFWKEKESFGRMHIDEHQPHEKLSPEDPTHNLEEETENLIIDRGALETWFDQLQDRVLIGLCHGSRPSMEALKSWVAANWENKNIFPYHIQYLPNNYYLFFFDDNNSAFQVISRGQWIIKSTPLSFFRWHRGFDPKGDKPSCIPIWVDFPDLLVEYYPWLKNIGAKIGKVLGQ
ncbi:hypothetical protein L7F22_021381 [Adiantum nelumboides]|nr:hypothetical protein [Adiantum nelumboides]